MLIQVLIVLLIGVVFVYFGYLIFSMKVPTLIDLFLKGGISFHDKRTNRFFGSIIIIIGILIILSPLIFGVENMNF